MFIKRYLVGALLFFSLFLLSSQSLVTAEEPSLPSVTIINPIRGTQLGLEQIDLLASLKGQWQGVKTADVPATWLWQYSAMEDQSLMQFAKTEMNSSDQEFGIFLEIDWNSAQKAGVTYHSVGPWYFSDGLLLVSYEQEEREKLIDASFAKFKDTFGYYPKTVGAWWVGAQSIEYMQRKYGIIAVLQCADQFSTDRYSLWGTPWSIPYAPSKRNAAIPADSLAESIPNVVILQWAARDPVMAYGDDVQESIYSMQDQSEMSYINYLRNIFLHKPLDNLVFGLESGFPGESYVVASSGSYLDKLQYFKNWENEHQLILQTASAYANDFNQARVILPPTSYFLTQGHEITDQSFWYNSPAYRIAIEKKGDIISVIDIRDYLNTPIEEFYTLPNTQTMIRVNPLAVLDTIRFPNEKIILAKTKEKMTIKEDVSSITLFAGEKLLATFTPTQVSFTPFAQSQQVLLFKQPWVFPLAEILFLCLFGYAGLIVYLYRKNPAHIAISIFCLGVYLLVFSPLYTSGKFFSEEMFFSQQSTSLIPYLSYLPFSITINVFLLFQLFPLIALVGIHFLLTKKLNKISVLLFTTTSSIIFLFFFRAFARYGTYIAEYFFISEKIKLAVLLIICILGFGIFLVIRFYRSKKEKSLLFLLIMITLSSLLLASPMLLAKKNFILTPFELAALELVATQHKPVMYLQPENPTAYRQLVPLVLEQKYAEALTRVPWEDVLQKDAETVFYQKGKLIFIPRYTGADVYHIEDKKGESEKIFDNGQIGIFEN